MGVAAGMLGGFLGALLVTFLVTRAAIRFTGHTRKGAVLTFVIGLVVTCGLRVAVWQVLDGGYGNISASLVAYVIALAIWLARDYRNAESTAGQVEMPATPEGQPTHLGLLALGYSKLNPGLLRLWLLINAVWVVFCAYQLYSSHRNWEDGFAAAKAQAGALESMRNLWIQNYMFDAKDAHEKAQKDGLAIAPFDEARTRDEAYAYSLRLLERSEEKRQADQLYRDAFDSRDRRDSFLPWVPTVPVGTAFLFIAIPWVIRGFKK